jgi:hypothetical protein
MARRLRNVGPRRSREPKPKDLRDSQASHLLTLGIPIGYISRQLGHAGTSVTEQRYARWVGDSAEYRQGPNLAGKVPADLLAPLSAEDCHRSLGGRRAPNAAATWTAHLRRRCDSRGGNIGRANGSFLRIS